MQYDSCTKHLEGAPLEKVMPDQLNYVPTNDPNFSKPLACVPIYPVTGIVEGFTFNSTSNILRLVILFLIGALIYYLVTSNQQK